MTTSFDASFWDQRFGGDDFIYGTAPNEFVAAMAGRLPPGPVLCLAEGEGRNAVHLATLGHAVTAVDQSAVGLAKARRLAAARGVAVNTVVADLVAYPIERDAWAGIVMTYGHLSPALRRDVLIRVVRGLQPGGVFLLEAYTPAQLAFTTGGPACGRSSLDCASSCCRRSSATSSRVPGIRAALPWCRYAACATLERLASHMDTHAQFVRGQVAIGRISPQSKQRMSGCSVPH